MRVVGKPLERCANTRCHLQRLGSVGGEFSSFDWRAANFTHCDLTNSELGELDVRGIDLQGVKLDSYQIAQLMERLGIVVLG